MSIWYPSSGITFSQYIQASSLLDDVSNQIRTSGVSVENKISQETERYIASTDQLSASFQNGFDSLTNSIEWGLEEVKNATMAVGASIDSLNASFNYNMGLLLEKAEITNKRLSSLIKIMDNIQKILESPTLTRAREFYNIGCERLAKGLLDKSLEAFIEAMKINDTDFFIQFRIGKLYLYGIDADDNVLDLEKARQHLLNASRYAKAETSVDPIFFKYAAEAMLHASIAVFAKLGNPEVRGDKTSQLSLLQEAVNLVSEAVKLNPDLAEAKYHLAKYFALLDNSDNSISSLKGAIVLDRNYTIKAEVDHSFDAIRHNIRNLYKKLYEEKKADCDLKLRQVKSSLADIAEWHLEDDSRFTEDYNKMLSRMAEATGHFKANTYYGYLDTESILDEMAGELPLLKKNRKDEIRGFIEGEVKGSNQELPQGELSTAEIAEGVAEVRNMLEKVEREVGLDTFDSYCNAKRMAIDAHKKAKALNDLQTKENENRRNKEEAKRLLRELRKKRTKWSIEYAFRSGKSGVVIGGIIGFVSCTLIAVNSNPVHMPAINLFSGAILGGLIGLIGGAIYGQLKEKD